MWHYVGFVLLGIPPLILYRHVRQRKERALAKALGCQQPRNYPLVDLLFGLDFMLETIRLVRGYQIIPAAAAYHEKYSDTFRVTSQGKPIFYTIDPANLQAIYEAKTMNWGVEPHRLGAMGPLCGAGFITSDGKDWERAGALLKPSLASSSVDDLATFDVAVNEFLDHLPRHGDTVDMSTALDAFFLDRVFNFLLGQTFGAASSQKPAGVPDGQTFLRSLHISQFWANMRVFFGVFGHASSNLFWRPHLATVHRFIDHYVNIALQEQRSRERLVSSGASHSPETVDRQRSLISSLVEQTNDRHIIRWQIIQTLTLMQDATSTLVSNTLFLLSRSPATWVDLRKEIMNSNPDDKSATVLSQLGVLQNILKESLRLYPILGQAGRTALKDTVLPAGGGPDASAPVFVPAGSTTVNSYYALHRQTAVFGNNAESFYPDRWNHISPGPCEYMPFGYGRRRCAGEHKALLEASYVLAKMALRFARIESRDDRDWTGDWKLIVRNLNGCEIALFTE